MKKAVSMITCVLLMLCLFSGCEDMKEPVAMREWYFDENKEDFAMYFGILNYNEEYIYADVEAEITIINNNEEIVYNKKKALTEADFGSHEDEYENDIEYLARIPIPRSEVLEGTCAEGNVRLQIYQNGKKLFPAVYDTAYSLPKLKAKVKCDQLPKRIVSSGYYQNSDSELLLTEFSYENDKTFDQVNVTLKGEIVREGDTFLDWYYAKIYDSTGKLADSVQLSYEGFKEGMGYETTFSLYNLTPGEEYTLEFEEYN